MNLQADMFEDLLASMKVKEVNILAHDLGLTVALELLARQVSLWISLANPVGHDGHNHVKVENI